MRYNNVNHKQMLSLGISGVHTRANLRGRLTILQAARITAEYTATALITQRNIRSSVYTVDNPAAYMNMQFLGVARRARDGNFVRHAELC